MGWRGALFGDVGDARDAFRMLQERGNDLHFAIGYSTETFIYGSYANFYDVLIYILDVCCTTLGCIEVSSTNEPRLASPWNILAGS